MYEFGAFRLDPADRVLLCDGQVLALTPKSFDLLLALVRNAGRVVLKDELMREVWPGTFVEENNLTVTISVLRKILEDGATGQSHIQTVPRRGYRFAASVRHSEESLPIFERPPDGAEAAKYDSESLEVARANKVREAETNAFINLGYDCTQAADPEKARSSFGKARAILDVDVWLQWGFQIRLFAGQATHYLLQRQLEEAERYATLLFESANRYEAWKYVAIAEKLLAEIAIARGDLAKAETHLDAAVNRLAAYPVPFVEWRVDSLLGRLRLQRGDETADEAFEKASQIVQEIATSIEDEKLRASFLGSRAVRELSIARVQGRTVRGR